MAAPNSAYRTISLYARKAGANIQHRRAIIQTSLAVMKSRFYLDDAFISKDAAGNDGLVGVIYPGTANYIMHANARFGTLRKGLNGQTFNDAGLNTFGKVTQPGPAQITFDGVQAIVPLTLISAYYVDTDAFLTNYSLNGGAFTGDIITNYGVAQGLTEIKNVAFVGVHPTDVITTYFGIRNAEGTYKTVGTFNYTVPFFAWNVRGEATWPSQTLSLLPHALYPASFPVEVGTIIKPTTNGSFARIDAGYYSDDDYWYQLSNNNSTDSEVLSMGAIDVWPVGDPAYAPPTQEWIIRDYMHREDTDGGGCFVVSNPSIPRNPIRLWQNENGKYYISRHTTSAFAPEGYYFDGTKSGSKYRWQRMQSNGEFWGYGGYGVCT